MLSFLLSPTGIFCFLNLVIGTIFITSQLKHQNRGTPVQHDQFPGHSQSPPQLRRATSSFLERVRSINYSSYLPAAQYPNPHEDEHRQLISDQDAHEDEQRRPISDQDAASSPPQLERPPSFLERVRSFKFSSVRSDQPDPVHHAVDPREVEEMPDVHVAEVAPAASKMKKSASEKAIPVGGRKEAETMKQRSGSLTSRPAAAAVEDEGVDEKANDFINRFKQQLKLQRMDSILRYREMLNRGASR